MVMTILRWGVAVDWADSHAGHIPADPSPAETHARLVWRFDAELPGPIHIYEQAIHLATNQSVDDIGDSDRYGLALAEPIPKSVQIGQLGGRPETFTVCRRRFVPVDVRSRHKRGDEGQRPPPHPSAHASGLRISRWPEAKWVVAHSNRVITAPASSGCPRSSRFERHAGRCCDDLS